MTLALGVLLGLAAFVLIGFLAGFARTTRRDPLSAAAFGTPSRWARRAAGLYVMRQP